MAGSRPPLRVWNGSRAGNVAVTMHSLIRPIIVTVVLVVGTAAGVLLLSGPASAAAPAIAEPGMLDGPEMVKAALGLLAAALGAGLIGYAVWPASEPARVCDDR
jgi:hypothetical protein